MSVQNRKTGCTPLRFLFSLQMKYARKSTTTTSTGTTTETAMIALFLGGLGDGLQVETP
jgi:hypothetical protein